jgi:hypothetical protein
MQKYVSKQFKLLEISFSSYLRARASLPKLKLKIENISKSLITIFVLEINYE